MFAESQPNEVLSIVLAVIASLGGGGGVLLGAWRWLQSRDEKADAARAALDAAKDAALAAKDAELVALRAKVESKDAELRHVSEAAVAKAEGWLERVLKAMDSNADEVKRLVEKLTEKFGGAK